jgi:hypothetical protein
VDSSNFGTIVKFAVTPEDAHNMRISFSRFSRERGAHQAKTGYTLLTMTLSGPVSKICWSSVANSNRGGIHALKAQFPQIERVDEGINHANRISLVDPIIEAFRQRHRLPPICPRNDPAIGPPADSAAES